MLSMLCSLACCCYGVYGQLPTGAIQGQRAETAVWTSVPWLKLIVDPLNVCHDFITVSMLQPTVQLSLLFYRNIKLFGSKRALLMLILRHKKTDGRKKEDVWKYDGVFCVILSQCC